LSYIAVTKLLIPSTPEALHGALCNYVDDNHLFDCMNQETNLHSNQEMILEYCGVLC